MTLKFIIINTERRAPQKEMRWHQWHFERVWSCAEEADHRHRWYFTAWLCGWLNYLWKRYRQN
jgi:hypothetical protein